MVLIFGVLFTAVAVAGVLYALMASPGGRVPVERRQIDSRAGRPVLTSTSDYLVDSVDRVLSESGWAPFKARELELAGIRVTSGSLVVTVAALMLAVLALTTLVTGSLAFGILLTIFVPVGAKIWVRIKTDRRRAAFTDQLDETIQMIASALRAGYSFPRALDAVATESESPTAEEFARVINENRIGRDLVIALEQTADRMQSDDFRWVAEAVAVHRDTGGNLNEVLDRVGATMRERNQVRQQVNSLASEGKFSAVILMALPVFVGVLYAVINPSYMAILINTSTGIFLLGVSLVMYIIGGFWMRAIVNVKF
jgi:tight adherence protein B